MTPSASDPFDAMELLRVFYTQDMVEGVLYRHEVRRDKLSGLTLTRKTPYQETRPPQ